LAKLTRTKGKPRPRAVAKKGRPSKYQASYAKQAAKLCKLGAIDRELAEFFEVSEVTINAWKAKHPNFLKSLKAGKEEADDRVERSLYQRAVGYSHPDVHVSNYQGAATFTEITKHYPPDTTACIFWLKNRQRDKWRDKIDLAHSGGVNLTHEEALDQLDGDEPVPAK